MINVCDHCGVYRADKRIDPSGPFAICPECGHPHPFRQLPLLIVSGASGAGKSTVCRSLVGQVTEAVLLDGDILWRPEFNHPENDYRDYFETWLRLAKNIAQSGRPVVLFGAGLGVPSNLEACIERRYFTRLHFLALVSSAAELTQRLQARPGWRQSGGETFIESQLNFNRWFIETGSQADPALQLLDTTAVPLSETTRHTAEWIRGTITQ